MRPLMFVVLLAAACADNPNAPISNEPATGKLIASERVACALTSANEVYCWGFNSTWWEYGAAPATSGGARVPSPASAPVFAKLARGVAPHLCGVASDGTGTCWGRGEVGQLGGGELAAIGNGAVTVAGGYEWADLSVSRLISCGVTVAGAGYCWGLNQQGELGSPSTPLATRAHTPVAIEGGLTFKSVIAGWLHSCGITTNDDAYCWGSNASGQLGIGSIDIDVHAPTAVVGNLKFKQLSLGSIYTCGIAADDTAWCWGSNATGQLGIGSLSQRDTPTPVAGGHNFTEIVASSGFGAGTHVQPPATGQGGLGHTCALTPQNRAYCWGYNADGQVGDGTTIDRLVPTPVAGNLTLTAIAVGGAYSCGMHGNRVWCWGSNVNGQLGNGSNALFASSPQAVAQPFR